MPERLTPNLTLRGQDFEGEALVPEGKAPREIFCPYCGAVLRRRPVNRYSCSKCGGEVTIEEKRE